jgi:hypothetical protein
MKTRYEFKVVLDAPAATGDGDSGYSQADVEGIFKAALMGFSSPLFHARDIDVDWELMSMLGDQVQAP